MKSPARGFSCDHIDNMEPRDWRIDPVEGLMQCIVRANDEVCSCESQLLSRLGHQGRNSSPILLLDRMQIQMERERMHGHLGVSMRTRTGVCFLADPPIAESGSFSRAGDNADVLSGDAAMMVHLDLPVPNGPQLCEAGRLTADFADVRPLLIHNRKPAASGLTAYFSGQRVAHAVQYDDDGFRMLRDRPRQVAPLAAAEVLNGSPTPRVSVSEHTDRITSNDEDVASLLLSL